MKLAISGETLGSVMELDAILKLFKKYEVRAIEIWPENIPLMEGRSLIHKRLYANRDIKRAKEIIEANRMETACVCFGAGFDRELAENAELFARNWSGPYMWRRNWERRLSITIAITYV